VYTSGGKAVAMTYSLNANLNAGTASKLAYYSGANTVAAYSSTVGASNRGIYISAGVPTAMSYYLNATVNSGTSGKLAYYSDANYINNYTSTIGSSTTPMYLSSGVPTTCSGVLVRYYASYNIWCTSSSASFSKNSGNFSPISSVSRLGTGRIKINFASGYSWY